MGFEQMRVGVCLMALSGESKETKRGRGRLVANGGEGRFPRGQRVEGGQQLDIRPDKPPGVGKAQSTNRRACRQGPTGGAYPGPDN